MIKILFLASNPKLLPELQLGAEAQRIEQQLDATRGPHEDTSKNSGPHLRHDIALIVRPAGLAELKQNLFELNPHVVHFSGHGSESERLLFEDKGGGAIPASAEGLSALFALPQLSSIRCVVLNACYSAKQAEGIARSVPCVIGVSHEIEDAAAIAFAGDFYQAIGFGQSVQEAFDSGVHGATFRMDRADTSERLLSTKGARGSRTVSAGLHLVPRAGVDPNEIRLAHPAIDGAPAVLVHETRLLHGRYSTSEPLEVGRVTKVERAHDNQLGRDVAIKTLLAPEVHADFEKEVRDIAKLDKHPNIVSIHEAWLRGPTPHYVRQYLEGESLRVKLDSRGRALPIAFVREALAAMGDAMAFARALGVDDLGIKPEKVVIQSRNGAVNLDLSSRYYLMICPEIAASKYIRDNLGRGKGSPAHRQYLPPEYFRDEGEPDNPDAANQYRLGVIGYEMLVGRDRFRDAIAQHQTGSAGPSKAFVCPPLNEFGGAYCPNFLRAAIRRMTEPRPADRFHSMRDAIAAIAQRDLNVEVARDSFRRILGAPEVERRFFSTFYAGLLEDGAIRKIFETAGFPVGQQFHAGDGKWQEQFTKLKEAIVFLFAHNLLKESHDQGGDSILTRIADFHAKNKYSEDQYGFFREALVRAVLENDRGNYPDRLREAWEEAVKPGLAYMKGFKPK